MKSAILAPRNHHFPKLPKNATSLQNEVRRNQEYNQRPLVQIFQTFRPDTETKLLSKQEKKANIPEQRRKSAETDQANPDSSTNNDKENLFSRVLKFLGFR